MAQTILERREQFHVLRLNEKLDALYPAVQRWFEQGRERFMQGTGRYDRKLWIVEPVTPAAYPPA
jgi:hypothetical protein